MTAGLQCDRDLYYQILDQGGHQFCRCMLTFSEGSWVDLHILVYVVAHVHYACMHGMGSSCALVHARAEGTRGHGVRAEVWDGRVGGGFVASQN